MRQVTNEDDDEAPPGELRQRVWSQRDEKVEDCSRETRATRPEKTMTTTRPGQPGERTGSQQRHNQANVSKVRYPWRLNWRGAATLGQRPPRLVLRVVLFSALTLGIGAATLLVFIRHFERDQS